MKPDKTLALGLLAFLSFGCNFLGDAKTSVLDRLLFLGAAGSMQVTPTGGGSLREPTMTLTVPQGAVEENTTITYSRVSLPEGQGTTVPLQAAYRFGPEKLQFNKAATLSICYDPAELAARGLQEKTMQIQYVNTTTGELVSMGGDVDLGSHCVSAPIYHFSTYTLTAQLLAIGNNAPTVGGAAFFPGTPIAGLPLTVRSTVTDWDAGSAVAAVRFYYRTAGTADPFQYVAMLPEANDGTGQFYTTTLPGSAVTAAGLDYYVQAFDSLGAGRLNPTTAPATPSTIAGDVPDGTTPIRWSATVTQMSAGFSRDLTLQVKGASAATFFPVRAETLSFEGSKGVVSRPTWLSARFTAQTIGASDFEATYGSLSLPLPSTPELNIYPGVIVRLDVLYNDAVMPDPFVVSGNSVSQLDAAGYDAFDNFMFVLPTFASPPTLGSFGTGGNYGKFTAANVYPDQAGVITATLGSPNGFQVSHNVLVLSTWTPCVFNAPTSTFDDGECYFGP